MKIFVLAAAATALIAIPALAAQPAYLDDRSTAASLVRSFYNAVNRHEYARAYTLSARTMRRSPMRALRLAMPTPPR